MDALAECLKKAEDPEALGPVAEALAAGLGKEEGTGSGAVKDTLAYLKTTAGGKSFQYFVMGWGAGLWNAKTIPPELPEILFDRLKTETDPATREHLAEALAAALTKTETVSPVILEGMAERLTSADPFTMKNLVQGLVIGLGKTPAPPSKITATLVGFFNQAEPIAQENFLKGLAGGLRNARNVSPDFLRMAADHLTQKHNRFLVNSLTETLAAGGEKTPEPASALHALLTYAKKGKHLEEFCNGLTRGFLNAERAPPELLRAVLKRTTGEQKGRETAAALQSLVVGLGKTEAAPPDILSDLSHLMDTAPPGKTFVIAGLVLGIEKADKVDPEILQILSSHYETADAGTQEDLRRGMAVGLGKVKTAPPVLVKNLLIRVLEDHGGTVGQKTLPVVPTLEKIPDAPPEIARLALAHLRQEKRGKKTLTAAFLPFLFQLLRQNRTVTAPVVSAIGSVRGRPARLAETAYFLRARAAGAGVFENELAAYGRALRTRVPPAARYDITAQVEACARHPAGPPMAWNALADEERLRALGPDLTAEEYTALEATPLAPGEQGKGTFLREHATTIASSWDIPFRELFAQGVELFGPERMFHFVGRQRDRALLEDETHESIFNSFRVFLDTLTDREKEAFKKNVFAQTPGDHGVDEEGRDARTQLWMLVKQLNGLGRNWKRVLHGDTTPAARRLYGELVENGQAFSRWKDFKRLRWLFLFHVHRRLMATIESFNDGTEAGERIYRYVYNLILDSGIADPAAVAQWVAGLKNNDAAFYARPDRHSALHEFIRPSRYFDFPRIDLTPRLLSGGLLSGQLDPLQVYQPFSMDYYPGMGFASDLEDMPVLDRLAFLRDHKNIDRESLRSSLDSVLEAAETALTERPGSDRWRDSSLKAVANARRWIDERDMAGTPPRAFQNRFLNPRFSFQGLLRAGLWVRSEKYRLRFISKSDPLAAVTGNQAPSCMGFGTGKNNDYLFNPTVGFFVLSKSVTGEDGVTRERILATSVVTLDRRGPEGPRRWADELAVLAKNGLAHTIDIPAFLGDDFFKPEFFVGIDNVEAAPAALLNRKDFEPIVQEAYRRFFTAYLDAHPRTPGGRRFNSDWLPVGTAHGDFLTGLATQDNLFLPQSFIGYSDKGGERVGVILLEGKTGADRPAASALDSRKGVRPLLPEDILEMAFLQNRVYAGTSRHRHFSVLQNEMIAALYNGAIQGRDREFLGMGLFDRGRLVGYVMAYGGVVPGTPDEEIYVPDHALLPEYRNSFAAGRLVARFLKGVRQHAQDRAARGKETTIFFETLPEGMRSSRWADWGLTAMTAASPESAGIRMRVSPSSPGRLPSILLGGALLALFFFSTGFFPAGVPPAFAALTSFGTRADTRPAVETPRPETPGPLLLPPPENLGVGEMPGTGAQRRTALEGVPPPRPRNLHTILEPVKAVRSAA